MANNLLMTWVSPFRSLIFIQISPVLNCHLHGDTLHQACFDEVQDGVTYLSRKVVKLAGYLPELCESNIHVHPLHSNFNSYPTGRPSCWGWTPFPFEIFRMTQDQNVLHLRLLYLCNTPNKNCVLSLRCFLPNERRDCNDTIYLQQQHPYFSSQQYIGKNQHCILFNKVLSGQMNTKEKSGSQGTPNPVKCNIWKMNLKISMFVFKMSLHVRRWTYLCKTLSKVPSWGLFFFLSLNPWFVSRLCYTQCRNLGTPAATKICPCTIIAG